MAHYDEILDNELITGRPKQLFDKEFYTELPKNETRFNYSSLPTFLNVDLLTLCGIMPKTMDLIRNTHVGFKEQPSKKEVEYYRRRNTRFQIVHVIANIHTFKKENKTVLAYPYAISIMPGPKRGKPDTCSIDFLDSIDILEVFSRTYVYTDFSPFKPLQEGFYADVSFLFGLKARHFTDTIGFVLENYFLPTDLDIYKDEIPMHGPQNLDPQLIDKFRNYRIKRYFKPFNDIKPRKIWGCDSPIELFLVQGLANVGLFPVIQTLIFEDGQYYDNFYKMLESQIFIDSDRLITEADLFFPDKKLAVFCDSTKFHRNAKKKLKDDEIDKKLENIGIQTLRFPGKAIVESLGQCVKTIEKIVK
jgi:hypothetical protein